MRKRDAELSPRAKRVKAVGQRLGMKWWGNVNWAIAEAVQMETPTGEVHLHWMSRKGIGNWRFIQNPQWRGEICGTARCRRVVIEPLGGENESANLGDKGFDELRDEWIWTQVGAVCDIPRWHREVPYVRVANWGESTGWFDEKRRREFEIRNRISEPAPHQ